MNKPLVFNTGKNGFCVARPGGKFVVLFNQVKLVTENATIALPMNEDPIWLDLSISGKVAGTSQQIPNKAWEYDPTTKIWKSSICYSVPRCCIYLPGNNLVTVKSPGETGSLGYIQVSDSGLLVKTIDHYADKVRGIYEYIIRGNVTVGHGDKSNLGDNPLICIIDNKTYLLEKGNCLAIKFYRELDDCAIAWINGSISKVWFPTVAELKTFPIYNPVVTPVPPIPPEVPPVGLPTKVNDLWKQWNVKFPCPLGEDNIRQWVIRFCEQTVHNFPGEGFGTKSSTKTNPISKDTISQISPSSAANAVEPNDVKTGIKSWDLVQGAGSTSPKPIFSGHTEYDTTNQYFRKVTPKNHMGVIVQPPTPIPPVSQDRAKLIEIRDDLIDYLEDN